MADVVADRPPDAARYHHCPRLTAYPLPRHLLVEVIHHDLGLQPDGVVVVLHIPPQLLTRPLRVELRISLHRLHQAVVAVHRRVVRQHVDDEPFLDGLLHRVGVEGPMLGVPVVGVLRAEYLQRLVLGRGREGEVAGVGQQFLGLHQPVDLVFGRLVFVLVAAGLAEGHRHRRRGLPALAGVRLVDDDGEPASPVLVADGVQDDRELLDRRDHDPLAVPQQAAQVAGRRRMTHHRSHLGELPDGVPDLLVQQLAVGHHHYRIEDRLALSLQPDQLVRQPGNGVRLPAARRVLNQIGVAHAVSGCVVQQPPHHLQLVIPGPDLRASLASRLLVLRLHDLRIVLDDVRQAVPRQDLLPQVVRLQSVGVRRVPRPVDPALVERQEPRGLAAQLRAELRLVFVHREMRQAAPKFEQLLPRVPVPLVLLHRVVHRLFRQTVLQLEGRDRQTVDEQAQVQGQRRLVLAVAQLPRHAEAVLSVQLLRLLVLRRRRAVEHVNVVRPVLHAFPHHVNSPALTDLPLQPGQEAPPCWAVAAQVQRVGHLRLR